MTTFLQKEGYKMFVKSHVTILNVNKNELPPTETIPKLPNCIDLNELRITEQE